MADVRPFRGWRYDLAQVGSLGDVVAPPYDVIDPAGQTALYQQHPCNVVRLILNRVEPGDESPDAVYERAASFLRRWQSEGILVQEQEPAFYVYHQVFDWEGVHYERKGFLGACRLEEFGEGQIYAHEKTMSGPKADRLKLTKACKHNLSPIFGLYPDENNAAQQALEAAIQGVTPLEVTDDQGVRHRFWPVTDEAALEAAHGELSSRPVFIADGHHRYETACNYRNWLREQGQLSDDEHPANFVLMALVSTNDPGLAILPTHRLLSGLPEIASEDLERVLADAFETEAIGEGPEGAEAAWQRMREDGGQDVFGFGTGDGRWIVARARDTSRMDELAPDQTPAWRSLGVSILHQLVIDTLLKGAYADAEIDCKYVHEMDEVQTAQREGSCQLACLVAPATMDHVREIASRFERMPPKSTFFYPKLLSGLVIKPLE